jgi:phage repressor protein C with HTH and peptisase S24 domain
VKGVALFPLGLSESLEFKSSRLYEAVLTLGIGALPLLPTNTGFVEEWIEQLFAMSASELSVPGPPFAGWEEKRRRETNARASEAVRAWTDATADEPSAATRVIRLVPRSEARPYETHLPLYSLQAAAGHFLDNRPIEEDGWVEVPASVRPRDGMFVARILGNSMEPRITDGSYGIFRAGVSGSRQGRVVLVQLSAAEDPEGSGAYTVKRYKSSKTSDPDTGWQHESVTLESLNPTFAPIMIRDSDDVKVIAEYLGPLPV